MQKRHMGTVVQLARNVCTGSFPPGGVRGGRGGDNSGSKERYMYPPECCCVNSGLSAECGYKHAV